jgi:hypothetical protein
MNLSKQTTQLLLKARIFALIGLLLSLVSLTNQMISMSFENQIHQRDYAEINDIKYGLFSIDQWKIKLAKIVNQEISKFEISPSDRKTLKPLVEEQLSKLIDNVYQQIREANQRSLKGTLKQMFIESFVDLKEVKEQVPQYANDALDYMQKPKTKAEIRSLLLEKVDEYFQQTFEKQDASNLVKIRTKWGDHDLTTTKQLIKAEISALTETIYGKAWLMIGLAIVMFILAFIDSASLTRTEFFTLVFALLALLAAGVTTPMINLEAKISEMSFVLFDQPAIFSDQFLYFQSKSILDVFSVMFAHPDLQMKVVGILLVAFSVIFPALKLSFSCAYFLSCGRIREIELVKFFVLKSGKWSMTDVFVIAIFLAYIGLNGIVANQFDSLHKASDVVLLTTNGTSLQPGFYLFFAYALLALWLSALFNRSPGREA